MGEVVSPDVPLRPNLLSLVVACAVLSCVAITTFDRSQWHVDANGITVRAAALFLFPLNVPWATLERVQTVVWGGGIGALKLDGHCLFQSRVTLVRARVLRVRFTPNDIGELEVAVGEELKEHPEWKRTSVGWERTTATP